MSIQWADNFAPYGLHGVNRMLDGVYAQILGGQSDIQADPSGAAGLVFVGATGGGFRLPLTTLVQTAGMAMRIWCSALPTDNGSTPQWEFRDNGNLRQGFLQILTNGQMRYTDNAGTVHDTAGPVVTANAWWHVEMKQFCNVATGTFELRVEGVPKLVLTGINTGANQIAQVVQFLSGSQAPSDFIKDFVLWDTTGTVNTDFQGTVLVANQIPTADINTNWTLTGAATRFAALANAPPLDTTQFITAVTPPPSPYVADMSDLSGNVTSVRAVITMVRATKTDGGDANLQVGLISSPSSGPATALGANRPITVAPTYWRDVFEVDPKTGVAWLPAAVNAAQLQLNRTV